MDSTIETRILADLQRLPHERWRNGPDSVYRVHDHPYHKILYCLEGSITFTLEPSGARTTLQPGDRLEIPPLTAHSAVVGPDGVTCIEAHKD